MVDETSHYHVFHCSTWTNCGHARGTSCTRENETAAYMFLGPPCHRGLGRTGADRCGREWVQCGSWVSELSRSLAGRPLLKIGNQIELRRRMGEQGSSSCRRACVYVETCGNIIGILLQCNNEG